MSDSNRMMWMKWHAIAALFFLPAGLLIISSGVLHVFDITGSTVQEKLTLPTEITLQNGEALIAAVKQQVSEKKWAAPHGEPEVRADGLFWRGSETVIRIKPATENGQLIMEVTHNSLYKKLAELHKAHGGLLFKILGVGFAISLFMQYISGFVLTLKTAKLLKPGVIAILAGALSAVIAFSMS